MKKQLLSKYSLSVILLIILTGLYSIILSCGGGGNGDGSSDCRNTTGAGWVTIDSAVTSTGSAFMQLTGTAFISPTWYRCCSGSADDTGVTISWSNPATGDSGIAHHDVKICHFLWSPYLCDHTWSATVSLALGNNTITVTASDPGINSGSSCISIARSPDFTPPMVYSVSPKDGAMNALPGTTVSANFSEVMLSTSITPSTFTLKGPRNVPVDGTISIANIYSYNPQLIYHTRVDFQPLAMLDAFATYTAIIDGSVKDYAGNNVMGQTYTWHFSAGIPISGRISYASGFSYGGVTLKVELKGSSAVSYIYSRYDTGTFMFVAQWPGTYTFTPFDNNCGTCTFTPTSRTVTVSNAEVSGLNFTSP